MASEGQSNNEEITKQMLEACSSGNKEAVLNMLSTHKTKRDLDLSKFNPASQQETATGASPLIMAAKAGHIDICKILLEHGSPWNALDKQGKCAGNYASDNRYQKVVDLLVDAAVKAEFILGASQRLIRSQMQTNSRSAPQSKSPTETPVEFEPCTKPDYLTTHNVRYNPDQTSLLDDDGDAIMMEWERPLMQAHASMITSNSTENKKVMNVGFGMGIIDTILQDEMKPSLHIIIEAHPKVYENMIANGWDKKPNVRICFGKWQDEIPKLIKEGVTLDGIFFDTYGEHFLDLEDFHEIMVKLLSKPYGIYSFFNGLAPDNIFFHGVACQCVKLQLSKLGLDTEFVACEIKVDESAWKGVRRKYWHGDTYYLPICTWNKSFVNDEECNSKRTGEREQKKLKTDKDS